MEKTRNLMGFKSALGIKITQPTNAGRLQSSSLSIVHPPEWANGPWATLPRSDVI
jgi:hypothetical protein